MAIRSQLQITLAGTGRAILIDVPTRPVRVASRAYLQKLAEQGRRIYCECGLAFDLTDLDDESKGNNILDNSDGGAP